MRMRKLNAETLSFISKGDVIKFKFQSGITKTGVVYDVEPRGFFCGVVIRINEEEGRYTCITKTQFDAGITFAILKKHSPVAIYNGNWDFVSNHQ